MQAETPCTGAPWRTSAAHVDTRIPSRYHPPPGLTGRGRFCAPLFHRRAGATRAYKWRGISGRTRAPCGWLIARTRARHLPRHAPLPRARGPCSRRRPFRRRHRRRPPDRRLDRSCMRPSPVPTTTRPQIRSQSACTLHANSCWLDGHLAGDRCRARGCGCAPRGRDTKALGQLFQVPVVLSRMTDRIIGCRARADVQTRCRPAAAIHNSGSARDESEWLAAKLRAEQLASLSRSIDAPGVFCIGWLDMCSFR